MQQVQTIKENFVIKSNQSFMNNILYMRNYFFSSIWRKFPSFLLYIIKLCFFTYIVSGGRAVKLWMELDRCSFLSQNKFLLSPFLFSKCLLVKNDLWHKWKPKTHIWLIKSFLSFLKLEKLSFQKIIPELFHETFRFFFCKVSKNDDRNGAVVCVV